MVSRYPELEIAPLRELAPSKSRLLHGLQLSQLLLNPLASACRLRGGLPCCG